MRKFSRTILGVASEFSFWIFRHIRGLINNYSDCCYSNETKVRKVKLLDIDFP